MASREASDKYVPDSERPRTLDTTWAALSRVVYRWTDHREVSADRTWWQNQRLGRYVCGPVSAGGPDTDQAVNLELSAADELTVNEPFVQAAGSNNWVYQSNLRVA